MSSCKVLKVSFYYPTNKRNFIVIPFQGEIGLYIDGPRVLMGYMTFPFVIVASIVCSLIGWDFVFFWEGGIIPIAIILIWAVLVFIGLRIFTNALDEPQVYIPYFKKFESQDAVL